MKMVAVLFPIAALLFTLHAEPLVLLHDTFHDGSRLNQELPASARWFGGSAGETDLVETSTGNYALKISPAGASICHTVAYFAPAGEPVSLAPGGHIRLTFHLTPLGEPSSGDNHFRFGLLYSGTARLTTDSNPDLTIHGGYGIFVNPDGSRIHFREKPSAPGRLFSSLTYWSGSKGSVLPEEQNRVVMRSGKTFEIGLTLTRLPDGDLKLEQTIHDGVNSGSAVFTCADGTYSFDTVGFAWGNAFGDALIENVKVSAEGLSDVRPVLPLYSKISVESRLPFYLNSETAILVFERKTVSENISVRMAFAEQDSGLVPASPMTVVLSGSALRTEIPVDIRSWPDGEYKTFISEEGAEDLPLVRGIRKYTLNPPVPPDDPFQMTGIKMFFVDDWYLEKTAGITRRLVPAEIAWIEPWKSSPERLAVRNSLRDFHVDQDGNYVVQIRTATSSLETLETYWAKSSDLKEWTVISAPAARHEACSIVNMRTSPVNPPAGATYRRYDPVTDGPVNLSQVRVRYTGLERDVQWGDIPVPYRSRLAVWEKPDGECLLLGDPITSDRHPSGVDEIGRWQDSNDNFGDARLSPDGKTLRCYQSRLVARHDPFRVHYDNILAERILTIWSSTNGVDWIPSLFDAPTLDDPWSTQHYGVDVWFEEDGRLQFSYLKVYDVQLQRLYTVLAYSRDGLIWKRVDGGRPFLENGPPGSPNYGYARPSGNRNRMSWDSHYYEPMECINALHFMLMAVLRHDDRSFVTPEFYANRYGGRMVGEYGVENSPIMNWHDSWEDICEITREQMFTPAFMRYRKDGWVGIAPEQRRAEMVTKVFRAETGLRINAKTEPDGFVTVELLDPNGNELPAYSRRNAASFTGDDVDAPLSWSGGSLRTLPNTPFKLRITLEKSELFTLDFR